ncbi:MAG: hypothetical protein AYK19_22110 [Theionarchaea archaeon DG-70-1]|nr:MAG: hypothetical protein AYK19_22110 [Theionarchaea archaeon DG-70-1]
MYSKKYPAITQGYGVFIEPDGGYIFPYEKSNGVKHALSPCRDLNVYACAILEHCTGSYTVEEIVSMLNQKFDDTPPTLFSQVESFLDEASQKGYVYYSNAPTQIKGLLQGSTDYYTPSRVLLETTADCNLKCGHCLLSAGEPLHDELPTEQLIAILETLFSIGVKRLSLSGGEILTKKGWDELIHFCSQRFYSYVLTNGIWITETAADVMSCLNEVHISLYGSNAETHEKISQVKGSFEQAVKGIKRLTERGVYVGVSVLMVPFNLDQLEDIVRMAVSLKCSIVRVGVIYPMGRAHNKEWELTESQKEWLDIAIGDLQKKYKEIDVQWEEKIEKGSKCGAGFSRWAVASNGDVYPCSVFRLGIGNLVKNDPADILKSPAAKFLQELEPPHEGLCGDCEYVYICKECHGQAFSHFSHVEVCRWAQQFVTAPEPLQSAVWKKS